MTTKKRIIPRGIRNMRILFIIRSVSQGTERFLIEKNLWYFLVVIEIFCTFAPD